VTITAICSLTAEASMGNR